jgi:conjugative transfer signal peptidase TraF
MAARITCPRLIWNASASAPIGFYNFESRVPGAGDFVLVAPNDALEKFITRRGYLPANIPLLKRVAALAGAEICREGGAIFIDKARVAQALQFDSEGRSLPAWQGCFILSKTQIFLLNEPTNSLDGRYFGATDLHDVIGVAEPLWLKENDE